ncbi:hypothetical protein BJ508DRAFT_416309 [Ascobolus immersus RN42]|uniref:Uncharacterized protein n=1 Tax=Ascobolus immersus RN42 TaxID=1160509 RepID=A0A3N4HY82_ASCIM|nr:hypothetical protein BJ508DRAFT_416309 [Ascobolus immersus RN42]
MSEQTTTLSFRRPTEAEVAALRKWYKEYEASGWGGDPFPVPDFTSESLPNWFRSTEDRPCRDFHKMLEEVHTVLVLYDVHPFTRIPGLIPPLVPFFESYFELYLEQSRFECKWECYLKHQIEIGLLPRPVGITTPPFPSILQFPPCLSVIQLVSDSNTIRARYKSGLLRSEQINLIGATIEGVIGDCRSIMRKYSLSDLSGRQAFQAAKKVENQLFIFYYMTQRLLRGLLCHENFRSERLEVLLLKYVQEDGCSENVLEGIQKAEKLKSWIRTCQFMNAITRANGKWVWNESDETLLASKYIVCVEGKLLWRDQLIPLQDIDLSYYLDRKLGMEGG